MTARDRHAAGSSGRHSGLDQPPVAAAGALVLAIVAAGGLVLWASAGEAVYVDRLISAIANCF